MKSLIIQAAELDNYNPDRFDAIDNHDGTITLIPLRWWDDASYADYQGDMLAEEHDAS